MKLLRTPYRTADFQTVRHCPVYFKHSGRPIDDSDPAVASLPYGIWFERVESRIGAGIETAASVQNSSSLRRLGVLARPLPITISTALQPRPAPLPWRFSALH